MGGSSSKSSYSSLSGSMRNEFRKLKNERNRFTKRLYYIEQVYNKSRRACELEPEPRRVFNSRKWHLYTKQKLGVIKKKECEASYKHAKLPLLKEKYRLISIIEDNEYGKLLKVQKVDENSALGTKMKNIGVGELKKDNSLSKPQENYFMKIMKISACDEISYKKSFLRGMDILKGIFGLKNDPNLCFENLIRTKECFILDGFDYISLKEENTLYLGIVTEHIEAINLDLLLKFNNHTSNLFYISGITLLNWFVKIIIILNNLHLKKLYFGDLRPQNLLIYFKDPKKFNTINIKLFNFGFKRNFSTVNKIIVDKLEQVGDKEYSPLYYYIYAPPEAIHNNFFDEFTDSYSLGILFFQAYFGLSTSMFFQLVEDLFEHVKKSENLKAEFIGENKLKVDNFDNFLKKKGNFLIFLKFVHKKEIFYYKIIKKRLKKNPEKMINYFIEKLVHPKIKKRLTISELLYGSPFKTLVYILCTSDNKEVYDIEPDNITHKVIFTIIKLIGIDLYSTDNITEVLSIFSKCLSVLGNLADKSKKFDKIKKGLLKKGILDLICLKMGYYRNRQKLFLEFTYFLLKLYRRDSNLIVHISKSLRKNYLLDVFVKYLLLPKMKSPEFEYFVFVLLKNCPTCCEEFRGCFNDLFKKWKKEGFKSRIVYYILEAIGSSIYFDDKEIVEKFFKSVTIQKEEGDKEEITHTEKLLFLGDINLKKDQFFLGRVFRICLANITKLIKAKHNEKTENEIMENLRFLSKFLFQQKKNTKMRIKIEENLPLQNSLKFKSSPSTTGTGANNVIIDDGNQFRCLSPEKKHVSEIVSEKPFCNFKQSSGEEICIGYYEMHVVSGGVNDYIDFGMIFSSEDEKSASGVKIIINFKKGKIYSLEEGKSYKNDKKKLESLEGLSLPLSSNSKIGFGVTNKGNVLITYNNKIMKPFVKLNCLKSNGKCYSYFRVSGSDYFNCQIVFDKFEFYFNFTKDQISEIGRVDDNQIRERVINSLFKLAKNFRSAKKSEITNVASKIIQLLKKEKNFIENKKLIQFITEDDSFNDVGKTTTFTKDVKVSPEEIDIFKTINKSSEKYKMK